MTRALETGAGVILCAGACLTTYPVEAMPLWGAGIALVIHAGARRPESPRKRRRRTRTPRPTTGRARARRRDTR